jgi:DNA-binding transcriptional MerR regulator
MASEAEQVFYKLSELSALLGVETSVLRFWEKEFAESVKPLKAGPRKKLYRPRDLEVFREIKRLLHEERYTIAGARQRLSSADPPAGSGDEAEAELKALKSVLAETRKELLDLRRLLDPPSLFGPQARPARTPRSRQKKS